MFTETNTVDPRDCGHDPAHLMCSDCASDTIAYKARQVSELLQKIEQARAEGLEAGRREGMEARHIIRTLEEQQTDVNNAYAEGERVGRERGLEEAERIVEANGTDWIGATKELRVQRGAAGTEQKCTDAGCEDHAP